MNNLSAQIDDFINNLAQRRAAQFFDQGRPNAVDNHSMPQRDDFFDQQAFKQFFGPRNAYPNPAESPRDWPTNAVEEKERAEAISKRNAELREKAVSARVADYNNAYSTEPIKDAINPSHYKGIIGELQYLEVMVELFGPEATKVICLGNVYKYLFRHGKKDAVIQEMDKVRWYTKAYINLSKYGKVFEPGNTKKEL